MSFSDGKFSSHVNDWKRLCCWFMMFNLFNACLILLGFLCYWFLCFAFKFCPCSVQILLNMHIHVQCTCTHSDKLIITVRKHCSTIRFPCLPPHCLHFFLSTCKLLFNFDDTVVWIGNVLLLLPLLLLQFGLF